MSLTRELVRLIRGKEITPADREKAALFVLDTLACAVGALGTEPAALPAARQACEDAANASSNSAAAR